MIDRSKRPGRHSCSPWALRQHDAQEEAALAESLLDPDTAVRGSRLIEFAWNHLNAAERARLLMVALTPEVRAAAATERGWA